MRSVFNILAVILIVFGISSLVYNGFTYTKREKLAEIGKLEMTIKKEKTVYLSPEIGGAALAIGILLIILGRIGSNRS